jgi:hypothetical protein
MAGICTKVGNKKQELEQIHMWREDPWMCMGQKFPSLGDDPADLPNLHHFQLPTSPRSHSLHISPSLPCTRHIPSTMAAPSGQTTQRLLRELKDYTKSPNESLLHLGPIDEEDLLRWEAVLKGVNGSPYEGM